MDATRQPVLLYDGECGLCNLLMRFMLSHDRCGRILFAPLQGATGQKLLRSCGLDTEDFDSLVFIADMSGGPLVFHLRTEGALDAFEELGGVSRHFARVLRCVPVTWRDAAYKLIARLRYRIFGHYSPTPLPNSDWKRRILD